MPGTKRTVGGVLGGLVGLVGLSAIAGLLVTAAVTPAIAVSGYAAKGAISIFDNLPEVLTIDKLQQRTTFYATNPENGEVTELTSFYDQNRTPVTFEQVPTVMYDAILSSEDPRFYEHGGVDPLGTARAILLTSQGNTQGGSSISQQYVKNVLVQNCELTAKNDEEVLACYNEYGTKDNDVDGYEQKLQEMRYAIALEDSYSKADILLGYLNIANFGGVTYGIEAASQKYFSKPVKDVSLAEAATLAGMVQNPNVYRLDEPESEANGKANGYAETKDRRQYVLGRMLNEGRITQAQHEAASAEPITPNISSPKSGCTDAVGAEYFCQYVRDVVTRDPAFGKDEETREANLRRGGMKIYTTLDPRLQAAAQETLSSQAPSSVPGMKNFGAAAVNVEATTGRVLAIAQNTIFDEVTQGDPNRTSIVYAGNDKFGNSTGFEAGSTFKLFTLLDWLEKGNSLNETLDGRTKIIKRVTNSCDGDWVNFANTRVNNFGGGGGWVGTPLSFTKSSLNTGFFAMAQKLDLCDIQKMATRLGVTLKDGEPVKMDTLNSVIGTNSVSPMAIAEAYATVANKGIYCQTRAIDRIVSAEGEELPLPKRTCEQVLDPAVAATAAYALQGVMNGGTGAQGNPYDGIPVLGKTGTHETTQTWLVESSTKVATAVWAGNSTGKDSVPAAGMNNIRYSVSREIQRAANSMYGGEAFPGPSQELLRRVLTDLPNVVGKTVDDARITLENRGFSVRIGDPINSTMGAGLIAEQNPGGGQAAGGTTITLRPSNGNGADVPNVTGLSLNAAISQLQAAGFSNAKPGKCTVSASADEKGKVTGTTPAAGELSTRSTAVTVNYIRNECG